MKIPAVMGSVKSTSFNFKKYSLIVSTMLLNAFRICKHLKLGYILIIIFNKFNVVYPVIFTYFSAILLYTITFCFQSSDTTHHSFYIENPLKKKFSFSADLLFNISFDLDSFLLSFNIYQIIQD